jgi:hypothetical protein
VLIVVERLFPDLLIAPVVQEPALRRLGEFLLGKACPNGEQPQRGIGIGCVFFAPEQRQVHLGDQHMSQFVGQQDERIARHEFHTCDPLLFGEALKTRIVQGRFCSGLDALRQRRLSRLDLLSRDGSRAENKDAERGAPDSKTPDSKTEVSHLPRRLGAALTATTISV